MERNSDRPLVETGLVKAHLIASVVAFVTLLLAGLLFSLQFLYRYPFPTTELLSPGRVRMVHTNLAAYGFIVNAFIAGLLWAVPRITKVPILSAKLGWFVFWLWQAIITATVVGLLAGYAQAIEWGETPIFVDPFVVLCAVLLVINLITSIIRCRDEALYVSLWYFTAGFIWLCLTYLMGNYFPQFFVPGAAGAAIAGLFIHDLVGLFVTPMGWGLMYYFVPIILKKPVWSHGLSLVGFWALAFCYPLNGVHHFLWSPIPMYAQYGAVVSTVAVEIVVTTVIVNFFATLWGNSNALRTSIPLRWFYTGMIFYFTTCLQCSVQVLLTVQEIIHFTDWVVGHAHLVMFGVFGFWIMGFLTYLWPKVVGKPWHSELLNGWHYWLTTIGMGLMFLDLVAGGLVQGFLWKALSPWENSIVYSIPFWAVRAGAGIMIFIGQIIFVYNLWATARKPTESTKG